MKFPLFISLLLLLMSGCNFQNNTAHRAPLEVYALEYARGFTLERHEGYTTIRLRNPWDSTKLLQTYLLVPDTLPLPEDLPQGTLIRTPVKRIIAYASAHCAFLEAIGAQEVIAGVCEPRFIHLDFVQEGIRSGKIADLGEAFAPNVEKIIELAPDAIITTPIEGIGYGQVDKIGIPLIEGTEYLEDTPLGRAEWMRFFGVICGREAEADSVFKETEKRYNTIKALTASLEKRPTILPENKIGSAWYVPGGNSYAANLYRDAGADYPWSDLEGTGSIPLSVESVMERGVHADVWIMKYNRPQEMTYTDLKNEYAGYPHFAAFKNKRIFACNTHQTPYYEEIPVHPDRVLENLVWLLHPELLPEYTPRYFKPMKE